MKTNKQEVVESLMAEHTNEEGLLEFGKYDHESFRHALLTAYEAGRNEAIKECEGVLKEIDEYETKKSLEGDGDMCRAYAGGVVARCVKAIKSRANITSNK